MCVVAIAIDAHPQWRLILAGNRDELHARPSAPLARWTGADQHIIAGRDLLSGGTWLGISEQGRLAVVTNIRSDTPPDPAKASRGALVADYLRNGYRPSLALLDGYNAFSLLSFGAQGATLTANRPSPMIIPYETGIHSLSNGEPQADWPRKSRLESAFAKAIHTAADLPDALLALLARESADDSIFIRDATYGTRCSSVVLIDYEGAGMIVERQFDAHGEDVGTSDLRFGFGNTISDSSLSLPTKASPA